MDRPQVAAIERDLEKKIVFLTGPRQVGKTTLAKSLNKRWPHLVYLNLDSERDRPIIVRQEWDRKAPLIILDEFHKLKKWKSKIKGVYDTEGIPPRLLITGSARIDLYRRGGDSMVGRYFLHRLYPFSVSELKTRQPPRENLDQLIRLGGFPEPFLSQSEEEAQRWRKLHLERVVREDIQDLEPVRDIRSLLLLVDLLRERVGSPVSFAALARALEVSPHTIKRWIQVLEHMYVLFSVNPYHRNLARAILKEPKIYFYDTGTVRADEGIRLENTVAVCLRKWLHFLEDTRGMETRLHYVRDKEKREVDFVILKGNKIESLVEVKLSDDAISRALLYYHRRLKPLQSVQLVHREIKTRTVAGIQITAAAPWLAELDL